MSSATTVEDLAASRRQAESEFEAKLDDWTDRFEAGLQGESSGSQRHLARTLARSQVDVSKLSIEAVETAAKNCAGHQ